MKIQSGMKYFKIGVGRPGQREETTYQRLVKRLDLEDPVRFKI